MRQLPTGTVTFLFTDIEGSTLLLQELGDGYAEVLAEHHRVLRAVFERHDGLEVNTQGDGFFVVFARAPDVRLRRPVRHNASSRPDLYACGWGSTRASRS